MRVTAVIHKSVLEENTRLKKEVDLLTTAIQKNKYRVNMAASIVNRFYQIKPLIQERKGAFRFDKWQRINELINLIEIHK